MIYQTASSGDSLVEVQAQVMTRDDSTQCWVPMGGGGLSNVKLHRLPSRHSPSVSHNSPNVSIPEYVIHGERVADNSVVLNCKLMKDIQYTKANPKFHHWNTDQKRFGLTFERFDDAKAFDRCIQCVIADLSQACDNDGILQVVDLPMCRTNSSSQSASTTSTSTSSPSHSPSSVLSSSEHQASLLQQSYVDYQHLHRVHYMPAHVQLPANHRIAQQDCDKDAYSDRGVSKRCENVLHQSDSFESCPMLTGGGDVWVHCDDQLTGKCDAVLLDRPAERPADRRCLHGVNKNDPYVIFDKSKAGAAHEYNYPSLESTKKPWVEGKVESTKKPLTVPVKPLSAFKTDNGDRGCQSKGVWLQRARCQHCRVVFDTGDNQPGSCDSAPDMVGSGIERVTCVFCTKCIMYHCMSDADGDFQHPCQCDAGDSNHCKKWTVLTILSFFIPCLWCYWPLNMCHKCGIACGLCGGRHKAG